MERNPIHFFGLLCQTFWSSSVGTFSARDPNAESVRYTLGVSQLVTFSARDPNAESVRQFQPRVALWQPWGNDPDIFEDATLKGLRPPNRNPVATPSESVGKRMIAVTTGV